VRRFEEYLATGWTLIGTADEVRESLQQYLEATGYQRVMLLMALPRLDTALTLRSMRLFVDEVVPAMTPVAPAQL
jgi:alkanesulfonate monooxygenase SsuD/methylene tetrahydromethanopterin reductase-like flavin-dependent oxidoreductase (luciferase family)